MIRSHGHGSSLQSFCDGPLAFQRYNVGMPASGPKRQPDPPSPQPASSEHHRTPQIYTLEATGLLVIAALVLIMTLVRYWHHIAWGAR
jgi:hypothetical protein